MYAVKGMLLGVLFNLAIVGHPAAQSADGAATPSASERIAILGQWYSTRDYGMLADELDWRHAPGFSAAKY